MEIDLSNEQRNNAATRWGLIMGVFSLAYLVVGYVVGVQLMINTWFFVMSIVFPIILLCVGIIRLRNSNNGFITFKDGFLFLLIVSIISSLIYILGQYVLYNMLDQNLVIELRNGLIDKILDATKNAGLSDEEKEEMIANITQKMQFDILSLLKSYLSSMVSLVVLSLLISAIVKRTPKEEIM